MITIVDYGMGNLHSVFKALKRLGADVLITSSSSEIQKAEKIIIPGVGNFAAGAKKLKETGLWDALNEAVIEKKAPILGICLGMQLMARHSEEGDAEGFGWFDASVIQFSMNGDRYKVPHIGWNTIEVKNHSALFDQVDLEQGFYFVHSYHMVCNSPVDVVSMTTYSYPFVSAVRKDNIVGVQFHPEKSHKPGEQFLRNFLCVSAPLR